MVFGLRALLDQKGIAYDKTVLEFYEEKFALVKDLFLNKDSLFPADLIA